MIFVKLFLTFFQIGAVSFGGGYAMISLIRDKVLINGWLDESQLLNMIAVSESTPGPIAVNMATFVGSARGGIFGSLLATLGVVLPSFIIILLIAACIRNFLKYKGVQAFLGGVRPCIVGLILATSISFFLSNILGINKIGAKLNPDWGGMVILGIAFALDVFLKRKLKKKISPIAMIIICAALGVAIY